MLTLNFIYVLLSLMTTKYLKQIGVNKMNKVEKIHDNFAESSRYWDYVAEKRIAKALAIDAHYKAMSALIFCCGILTICVMFGLRAALA